jgi:hypothetical protein
MIISSFKDFLLNDDGGNGERALSVTLYYYRKIKKKSRESLPSTNECSFHLVDTGMCVYYDN